MDGLDQVSDGAGCYNEPEQPRDGERLVQVQDRLFLGGPERWARLARTIEGEVIPRLMLVHSVDRGPRTLPRVRMDAPVDTAAVDVLLRMVIADKADDAIALIKSLMWNGVALETVYLDLLAPTARRLGEMWQTDECSFTDVTLGLCRLQRVMRVLAHGLSDSVPRAPNGRVVLAAVPGEQHCFGILMLEEMFRRDGWEVDCLAGTDKQEIIDVVRDVRPQVVGLSMSVDERSDELRTLIDAVRATCPHRPPFVMVGGRCFVDDPRLASSVGADITSVDGREAIGHIRSRFQTGTSGIDAV